MSACVVFGGKGLDEVFGLVQALAGGGTNEWQRALSTSKCEHSDYEDCDADLLALKTGLRRGELASIQFAQRVPTRMLLGLYAPRFCGGSLSEWLCVVEGESSDAEHWFSLCLRDTRIGFVAVCADDYPDLDIEHVTAETFPWDDWRVKRAAVRRVDGSWEERRRT